MKHQIDSSIVIDSPAKTPLKFTVYFGTIIHTPRLGVLEVIPNARVGVNTDGTIVFINQKPTGKDPLTEALEFDRSLVSENIDIINTSESGLFKFYFPGFIDTHIHAPQYPNCGVFGNSTLFDWLLEYTYPVEMALEDPKKAYQVYDKVVKKTLEHGTTCCAYYSTIHPTTTNILADCALGNGQRAFIGRSCMDCGKEFYTDESVEDGIKSTISVINHISKRDPNFSLIKPILSPRNANKCSAEFMLWLAKLSKHENIPIQVHMSETEEEVADILKSFTQCKNYASIYDLHNLLTENTVLGHCIFISEEELELINKRKSSIAHCPTSNSCLTSGEAKVRWMLDKNTKVGLGSDVSGGFSPSILVTARHAILVSRHVAMRSKSDHDKLSVNESLFLATLGGAQACGLDNILGSFEVGKKWECQLISLDEYDSPIDLFDFLNPELEGFVNGEQKDLRKFQDIIDKWVFNGDDRNIKKVYVNGRCVIDKLDKK